jgi:type II secretory pathway pseudopilin PulG
MEQTEHRKAGFTLPQVLIASAIAIVLLAGAFRVLWMCQTQWYRAQLSIRVAAECDTALRSLVYGVDGRGGLREASSATVVTSTNGWTLTYRDSDSRTNVYQYNSGARTIVYVPRSMVVCTNVISATVAASGSNDCVALGLVVRAVEGRYTASNQMNTSVHLRNRYAVP